MFTRRSMLLAALMTGSLVPPAVKAADELPPGTITLVVSFPPGGSLDVVTRALAAQMQERLGRPVVVENCAGASGALATGNVAKATPDGLTVLAAASSLAANPTLFKTLPFDTIKDLQAVALVFRTPLTLVVNPSLPVRSVAELIALLKERPAQINFGHGGPGSAIYLAAELFQVMSGTKMNGVAYRGAPLALNDVMAGHVALMFADVGAVIGQIKAGSVRALGVTSTERVPAMPDVPTIAESGLPGFDAVGWTLMCVPMATPKPIVNLLSAELRAATQTPEVQKLIVELGTIPVKSPPPAELQKFLTTEIDRWGDLIKRTGAAKTL